VCHAVLQDPAFFHFLTRIDEELAAATRLGGCRFCAGPLHVANYPRKPRGCPAAVRCASRDQGHGRHGGLAVRPPVGQGLPGRTGDPDSRRTP
jgi:hypothetical protein